MQWSCSKLAMPVTSLSWQAVTVRYCDRVGTYYNVAWTPIEELVNALYT